MKSGVRALLRKTPLRYYYHLARSRFAAAPQSDESEILARLTGQCPKTFVEFGFHPTEYNCIRLSDFSGLLVDGDASTVKLARKLLPPRIEVRRAFLNLENIEELGNQFERIGVLSVDVDGNDYWFLKALLPFRPSIIVAEYNASFGLRPVSVPYDPAFDRSNKHATGWYHGASLTAIETLCRAWGYKLVATSAAGGNAFFVQRSDDRFEAAEPGDVYRESALRNRWSGLDADGQWARIDGMPYIDCSNPLEEENPPWQPS